MDPRPNIIFCGNLDQENNKSWGRTNQFFVDNLAAKANIIGYIDYMNQNRVLRKMLKYHSLLFYGETSVRNPFADIIWEQAFSREYRKIKEKPGLVIHSSGICVPKGYNEKCPHVLYTDASIMGAVRYNNYNPGKRYLHDFTSETRKYASRLKRIFTFNEWTRESLITDFCIAEKKVLNIGFGANLNPYHGEKNYSNKLILTVLRRGLEKNKGLFLLLDSFKNARQQIPGLKLAVVGTTGEAADGVTYYDGFPREKTIELFQQASLFALPALYEPNGMVFIEALACKTPVLGLNRLAYPEFCGYGKFGFIAENNTGSVQDKIIEAFKDPERLETMGTQGQQAVIRKYNWETVVAKILYEYETTT